MLHHTLIHTQCLHQVLFHLFIFTVIALYYITQMWNFWVFFYSCHLFSQPTACGFTAGWTCITEAGPNKSLEYWTQNTDDSSDAEEGAEESQVVILRNPAGAWHRQCVHSLLSAAEGISRSLSPALGDTLFQLGSHCFHLLLQTHL